MKTLIPFGFLLLTINLSAQSDQDSLVQIGIRFHDSGDYDSAMHFYREALAIDSGFTRAQCEMAVTYMYAGNYLESISYCDKVINKIDKYLLQAYTTKASCLDELGRTPESIDLFEKTIKRFGDQYLLYYNLGIDYYRIKNYDKAQEALTKAIKLNPSHASSHLYLGYLMNDRGNRVQSLLSFHYFLLLEPQSSRSAKAYATLRNQFKGDVTQNPDNPKGSTITIDQDNLKSDFGNAELMLSFLELDPTNENKTKTDLQVFVDHTKSFFMILGESKKKKNKGLWWEFYVPFFYNLAKSPDIEPYCYYISQSSDPAAGEWIDSHGYLVDHMLETVNQTAN